MTADLCSTASDVKPALSEIVGGVADDYPLQKKRHSLEFLRSIAHLRLRTNTRRAAWLVFLDARRETAAFLDERF